MKKFNSIDYVISLIDGFGISELPVENRSDSWWCRFWDEYGLNEAQRIKEKV